MAALPSKPFAGIGIADAQREQAEGEGQHKNVQHKLLLCDLRGERKDFSPWSGSEVPLRVFVFEKGAMAKL
jgi:hypothetical protein